MLDPVIVAFVLGYGAAGGDMMRCYHIVREKTFYESAQKLKKEGKYRDASRFLWLSFYNLMQYYALLKGFKIEYNIDEFIEAYVDEKYKKTFRDLLDVASTLYKYYLDGERLLTREYFERKWTEAVELLKKAREVVYEEG